MRLERVGRFGVPDGAFVRGEFLPYVACWDEKDDDEGGRNEGK